MRVFCLPVGICCALAIPGMISAQELPFQHKIEVYREKDSDVIAFVLRLEQPFLAEEFEKSNYLRLHPLDRKAYLIYPKETKFQQKHAEFYGRLRGEGKAKVRLSYEIVSETLKGTRKVDVRQAVIDVPIPASAGGPRSLFEDWAKQQNQHFFNLLQYYPEESFFQYALLQSRERYGVAAPVFDRALLPAPEVEGRLYGLFSRSLALQETLQYQSFKNGSSAGDLTVHLSELSPPSAEVWNWEKLLEDKIAKKMAPKPHAVAGLIPEDQYFLHFHTMQAAGELQDLVTDWGHGLLRLFTMHAVDHRFRENFEEQLCLYREPLQKLFADGTASELAITGADPFFLEGTDVSILFRVKKLKAFQKQADEWLAKAKKKHPALIERDFNYREHKIQARYTEDRLVSSFVVQHGEYVIYSNSHRAIRDILDAATGKTRRLLDAPDYRYLTILLPPSQEANAGYFFASEAFLKRMFSPQAKISEKRRVLCFNNLVMLNHGSLLYRLENGKSPATLTDLYEGKFADRSRVTCPHGGSYSWDTRQETCTCSLHNRLKYLTPNAELKVLKVSKTERDEYDRYKKQFADYWQSAFNPIAMRLAVGPRVQIEVCMPPLTSNSLYRELRGWVDDRPLALDTAGVAKSAVASLVAVRGPKAIGDFLRDIPGITEALKADPTITDLSWLGSRLAVHFCDSDKVLELDPTHLRELDIMGFKVPLMVQAQVAAALVAAQVPTYFTIDVEDRDKAARLLELLTQKIPLKKERYLTLPATFDAYRLPDYKKHAHYVLSFQLHVLKMRLHAALVGNQLVAATKADILKEVIDAADDAPAKDAPKAHLLLRFNVRALNRLKENFQLSWNEKARLACHRNTISIYNLLKLYDVPMEEIPRLAEAVYGVRYFCPDHGVYEYDAKRDQVLCSVHGNRQDSRQQLRPDKKSSFAQFLNSLDEISARVRFQDEALYATVEIARRQGKGK